jgi:hypothetical protein
MWPKKFSKINITLSVLLCFAGIGAAIQEPTYWWIPVVFIFAAVWQLFPGLQSKTLQWAHATYKQRMRKRERAALIRRVPLESKVAVSEEGIRFLDSPDQAFVSWNQIVQVALAWDENPWEDPQFGIYNDIRWEIKIGNGRLFYIEDSHVHRFVVQPAFQMYLPGYTHIHDGFDKTFERHDGSEIWWARNP